MADGRGDRALVLRAVAGLFVALAVLGACQSTNNETSRNAAIPSSGEATEGSFSLSLTVGGGFRFGTVSYDVSGNGFHKNGSIDAAGSSTLSAVIGGIPVGTGYVLQLTAQDVDHQLTPCSGSAPFDVVSAATVAVPVHLTCHDVPQATPSVPVPSWVRCALGALLLGFGVSRFSRRRDRRPLGD